MASEILNAVKTEQDNLGGVVIYSEAPGVASVLCTHLEAHTTAYILTYVQAIVRRCWPPRAAIAAAGISPDLSPLYGFPLPLAVFREQGYAFAAHPEAHSSPVSRMQSVAARKTGEPSMAESREDVTLVFMPTDELARLREGRTRVAQVDDDLREMLPDVRHRLQPVPAAHPGVSPRPCWGVSRTTSRRRRRASLSAWTFCSCSGSRWPRS